MAIIHEGRLEHFRSLNWGGGQVTRNIALSLGVTLEEAERIKFEEVRLDEEMDSAPAKVQDAVLAATQACGNFASDLMHTIVAYKNANQKEIGSCLVTGGTSKLWGMPSIIATTLGVSVQPFPSFQGLNLKAEVKARADESRFAEPLGRGCVFLRKLPCSLILENRNSPRKRL